MKRSVLLKVLLVTALAGTAVGLFVWLQDRGRPIDAVDQEKLASQLDAVVLLDVSWSSAALQNAVELQRDYDRLTAPLQAWPGLRAQLGDTLTRTLPAAQAEESLRRLDSLFAAKADVVNRFKMRNSVLRNSLRYLPTAQNDLFVVASGEAERAQVEARRSEALASKADSALKRFGTPGTALDAESRVQAARQLALDVRAATPDARRLQGSLLASASGAASGNLVAQALRFNVAADAATAAELRERLGEFRGTVAALPPTMREAATNLIRHIDIVLVERPEVTKLLATVVSNPLAAEASHIKQLASASAAAVGSERSHYQQLFRAYAATLLALVLLGCAWFVRQWLRLASAKTELTEQVNKLTLRLIGAERASTEGRIGRNIAHEVNTPLAAVLAAFGNLQELAATLFGGRAPPPAEAETIELMQQCVGDGAQAAQQIAGVVSNLLATTRTANRGVQRVSTEALVTATLTMLRESIAGRAIKVTTDLARVPEIACDPIDMRQALMNLVRNAVEAMPDGGQLRISAAPVGGKVVLSVADTGTGIAPENLARVFDVDFTTKPDGVGVGLALTRANVERIGGSIAVSSRLGSGTVFHIELPSVAQPRPEAAPGFDATLPGHTQGA